MSAGPPSNETKNGPNLPLQFLVAGSEMASFAIVGLLLDYYLRTMPGFTIGLTLLGLVVSFFHLLKMAKVLGGKKPLKPPGGTGESGSGA